MRHTPLVNLFHPTKDELWLHLSLLDPRSSRLRILRRRLMPLQLPGPVDAVHLPAQRHGMASSFARRRALLAICDHTNMASRTSVGPYALERRSLGIHEQPLPAVTARHRRSSKPQRYGAATTSPARAEGAVKRV